MVMSNGKVPDLLINQNMQILQQLVSSALNKKEGITLNLITIGQLSLNMASDSRKLNSPDQKVIMGNTGETKRISNRRPSPMTKEELIKALNDNGWSKKLTSKNLNKSYSTICIAVKKWDIVPPSGKWSDIRVRERIP